MKDIQSEEYKNHKVFEQITTLAKFYEDLSFGTMNWTSLGTTAIVNLDTYVFSSMGGTLQSINEILKLGRINDAFALLRKYFDSTIINVYTNLYLSDNFNYENLIVEKVNNWLHGKDKLPEYRVISQYIRSSEKLKPITDLLLIDDRYKTVRDRCNDHTHYNYFRNLMLNNSDVYLENRIKSLNIFSFDLETIFIQHFSYIFYLNEHFMMSSDYMDYMEVGETPPKDCEYWVAPYVQNIFDLIKTQRFDIAMCLKDKVKMHLVE